jgi:hypothetical protein
VGEAVIAKPVMEQFIIGQLYIYPKRDSKIETAAEAAVSVFNIRSPREQSK